MSEKEILKNKKVFSDGMVDYMIKHYNVNKERAEKLVGEYIGVINVSDSITQHLGVDYFSIQILMEEEIIPYQPI